MASTSSTTPLPDGYRPPAAFVDADHHGAWIHICTAFGLVVGLISLCIRAYIRTKVSPPIRHDDSMTAVATFLSAIQAALTFAGVHFGYGTSLRLITEHDLEHLLTVRVDAHLDSHVIANHPHSSDTPPTSSTSSPSTPAKPPWSSSSCASRQTACTRPWVGEC
jgi:hypothetical protein